MPFDAIEQVEVVILVETSLCGMQELSDFPVTTQVKTAVKILSPFKKKLLFSRIRQLIRLMLHLGEGRGGGGGGGRNLTKFHAGRLRSKAQIGL